MTNEEKHLWYDCLKKLPVTVHRQKVIDKYIADFYIASASLIIELDGSQHYSDEQIIADKQREQHLNSLGISIVRYSNYDINFNFDAVCKDICNRLNLYKD